MEQVQAIHPEEAVKVKVEPGTSNIVHSHEPLSDEKSSTGLKFNFSPIHKYHYETNTHVLEKTVKAGLQMLNVMAPLIDRLASLKTSSTARDDDANRWQREIQEIKSLSVPTRTKIGVVGATGAGKSSLVNALLDEERLLLTSCTRACTAWVTEVSYNYNEDENAAAYRAEIEFVSLDDWSSEIEPLLQQSQDATDSSLSDHTDPNTDAGRAYLKLTTVYPHLKTEDLSKVCISSLIDNAEVQGHLGQVVSLSDTSSSGLLFQIQSFIGVQGNNGDGDNRVQYWPLIKIMRIFTRASALSTGAVIVDLPGIQDSNTARAAVATEYIKECSGLWVVAPISRAIDDKSARDLQGESFRRQMMFDNNYSALTFVCSKTDEIHVDEAVRDLGLMSIMESKEKQIDAVTREIQAVEEDIPKLKEILYSDKEELEDSRDKLDDLQSNPVDIKVNETSCGLISSMEKRKRGQYDAPSTEFAAGDTSTLENVNERQKTLRAHIKSLRGKITETNKAIDEKKMTLTKLQEERIMLKSSIKGECIKQRNIASTQKIGRDFIDGIKEMDDASMAEEAKIESDYLEIPPRDYGAIRDRLPVFCVSSRVYQKQAGMLSTEDFSTSGYNTPCDTGIPALQAHAQKLTETNRKAQCRQILIKLVSLLHSIACWVTGHDMVQAGLDATSIKKHLQKEFSKFAMNLETSRNECCHSLEKTLRIKIYDALNKLATVAAKEAPPRVDKWFAKKDVGGHDLKPMMFKTICRLAGVRIVRGNKVLDLNEELAQPIVTGILRSWERTFSVDIPVALQTHVMAVLMKSHGSFHDSIAKRYANKANMAMAIDLLSRLGETVSEDVSTLLVKVRDVADNASRKATREAVPPITDKMKAVYAACIDIRGRGSKSLMHSAVSDHVQKIKKTAFRNSVQKMQSILKEMHREIAHMLETGLADIQDKILQDYSTALLRGTERRELSAAEIKLKKELNVVLESVEARFKDI